MSIETCLPWLNKILIKTPLITKKILIATVSLYVNNYTRRNVRIPTDKNCDRRLGFVQQTDCRVAKTRSVLTCEIGVLAHHTNPLTIRGLHTIVRNKFARLVVQKTVATWSVYAYSTRGVHEQTYNIGPSRLLHYKHRVSVRSTWVHENTENKQHEHNCFFAQPGNDDGF